MRRSILLTSLLTSLSSGGVLSQQYIKLSTASAKFNLSITSESEPDHAFTTNQHFQFESATSKLFHTKLLKFASSNVVTTGVHVERMRNKNNENAASANNLTSESTVSSALTLESIVSVTLSDVTMNEAIMLPADGDWKSQTAANDMASILTKTVSSNDILKLLIAAKLVPEDASVSELSFAAFDGSLNERGVTSTETEFVSDNINDGWPMFFAGVMITLLAVSIVSVGYWVYKKEKGLMASRKNKNTDQDNNDSGSCCDSVHYEGDVDLEGNDNATTASGILGLMGHHPQAEDEENVHPNSRRAYRRNKRFSSDSTGQTYSTSDVSSAQMTAKSNGAASSATSKQQQPLGITSMRKLDTFLTPQKPQNDRVPLYDLERLTRT